MIRLSTTTTDRIRWGAGLSIAALALAACGGSSSGGGNTTPAGQSTPGSGESGASSSPGTKFGVADVSGLGNVVVDGRGYTVYVLTKPGSKNLPCTDASGCTKFWPDLSLPDGASSATAGSGLQSSLMGTKPANGETYPTYNGWLMYEYAQDSGPGQSNGEGVKSFGGTWYALSASGDPVDNS